MVVGCGLFIIITFKKKQRFYADQIGPFKTSLVQTVITLICFGAVFMGTGTGSKAAKIKDVYGLPDTPPRRLLCALWPTPFSPLSHPVRRHFPAMCGHTWKNTSGCIMNLINTIRR